MTEVREQVTTTRYHEVVVPLPAELHDILEGATALTDRYIEIFEPHDDDEMSGVFKVRRSVLY